MRLWLSFLALTLVLAARPACAEPKATAPSAPPSPAASASPTLSVSPSPAASASPTPAVSPSPAASASASPTPAVSPSPAAKASPAPAVPPDRASPTPPAATLHPAPTETAAPTRIPTPPPTISRIPAPTQTPASIEVEVKETDAFDYICLESTGPYTSYRARLSEFLREFVRLKIKPISPLMTVYWNSPLMVKTENLRWDIGYAVGEGYMNTGNLVVKRFAYPRVAVATHRGPYATTNRTITALYDWLRYRGIRTFGGPCVEYYLDDNPSTVPDERKTTLIAIPVQSSR